MPSQINNKPLLEKLRIKSFQELQKNIDYFIIPQKQWHKLYNIYKGGPPILLDQQGNVELLPMQSTNQFQQFEPNRTLRGSIKKHVGVINRGKQANIDTIFSEIAQNSDSISQISKSQQKKKYVISSTVDEKGLEQLSFRERGRSLTYKNQYFPRGLIGLDNQGNNCYMNSILQCIMSIEQLRDFFLNTLRDQELSFYPFCQAIQEIFLRSEESSQVKYIMPSNLQRLVHQKFYPVQQHDSHEFLLFLMSQLNEEIKKMDIKYRDYSKSNISVFIEPVERDISQLDIEGITLTIPDEKECDRSYSGEETDNHWKRYMKQNTTIIDHLFTGFFKSTVSCTKCGAKSTSHDPFITLSIPSNYPTITQSLDYFFQEESLLTYFCMECNKIKQQQLKTINDDIFDDLKVELNQNRQDKFLTVKEESAILNVGLSKLPEILVLHLKRFQTEYLIPTNIRKIKGHIRYPITLDNNIHPQSFINQQEQKYELISVVSHWGSNIEQGHYISIVKRKNQQPDTNQLFLSSISKSGGPSGLYSTLYDQNRYFFCNDKSVGECDEQHMLNQEAYLLVYQKVI